MFASRETLSHNSITLFFMFVCAVLNKNWQPSTTPSVFMTDEGFLQLVWEDSNGHTIELEFTNNGIEYYFESSGKEGSI